MIKKPDVLSEDEKLGCSLVDDKHSYKQLKVAIDEACIHQRDADVAWFNDEYPIKYREKADEVGDFIDKGWVPPEQYKMNIQQAKTEVAREIKKQLRAEHKSLEELSRACFIFLRRLDEVMADAKGNPLEAGKTIAALANRLEMANDEARYFNLGVDYRKDDKDKVWQSLKGRFPKEAA